MCTILCYAGHDIGPNRLQEYLLRSRRRGPDDYKVVETPFGYLCFARLAIMGLSPEGMQPFEQEGSWVVCNGEVYGFRRLKEELAQRGYTFKSGSDCEVLLPLWREYGCEMFAHLDAEFACVLYDGASGASSLPGTPSASGRCFTAIPWAAGPSPLPARPPTWRAGWMQCAPSRPATITRTAVSSSMRTLPPCEATSTRRWKRCAATFARSWWPGWKSGWTPTRLGFLLSGGLDSSLVCAIAAKKLQKSIRTFAIGMEGDAIDLKYARDVADFIGADHTEVIMTKEQVLEALPQVVQALATWDITTIRASVGMYLVCKAIHESTDVTRAVDRRNLRRTVRLQIHRLCAERPEFQKEAAKRIRELFCYDVLRADRCLAANSLEARVPFGDLDFVRYVMSIDPARKLNTYGKGKYLLRKAFEGEGLLPEHILWREKAAFSDAVGHSMVDDLKEYAEALYTDEEFRVRRAKYDYCPPFTKESLLYRELFERFYPGGARMIPGFWMPTPTRRAAKWTIPAPGCWRTTATAAFEYKETQGGPEGPPCLQFLYNLFAAP